VHLVDERALTHNVLTEGQEFVSPFFGLNQKEQEGMIGRFFAGCCFVTAQTLVNGGKTPDSISTVPFQGLMHKTVGFVVADETDATVEVAV